MTHTAEPPTTALLRQTWQLAQQMPTDDGRALIRALLCARWTPRGIVGIALPGWGVVPVSRQ